MAKKTVRKKTAKKKATKKKAAKKSTALTLVKKPARRRARPPQRLVIEDPNGILEPRLPAVPMAPAAAAAPPHELGETPYLGYGGMSESDFTEEQQRILMAPILTPDEVEEQKLTVGDTRYYIPIDHVHIKPTGAVYLPQMRVRQRLSLAFGPGGWGVAPVTKAEALKGDAKGQQYALLVGGKLVGYAFGEQDMFEDNQQQSEAAVMESIKSNAIVRGSKDLMIGADCWDPAFGWKYQQLMCVRVWRERGEKPQWRRFDQPPWWNETGITDDSPNRDKYVGPYGRPEEGNQAIPQPGEPAFDRNTGEVIGEPAGPPARAPQRGAPRGGRKQVKISEPQVRRLRAIALEHGWREKDDDGDNFPGLHKALEGVYGIEHFHDIIRGRYKGEYDDIIEAIESGAIKPEDYQQ